MPGTTLTSLAIQYSSSLYRGAPEVGSPSLVSAHRHTLPGTGTITLLRHVFALRVIVVRGATNTDDWGSFHPGHSVSMWLTWEGEGVRAPYRTEVDCEGRLGPLCTPRRDGRAKNSLCLISCNNTRFAFCPNRSHTSINKPLLFPVQRSTQQRLQNAFRPGTYMHAQVSTPAMKTRWLGERRNL